jgi:hypothetical protein
MMTLDDARNWYLTTRSQLQLFSRLGRKHWDSLPGESPLWRDDQFKALESGTIVDGAAFCLEHLDDFAVLILFSVFEAIVREQVRLEIEKERERVSHALVTQIVERAIEDIDHGSFFRILEVYKKQNAELIEEVNQVRKYRNWVAHGRRGDRSEAVDPETAYNRLEQFLAILISHTPGD